MWEEPEKEWLAGKDFKEIRFVYQVTVRFRTVSVSFNMFSLLTLSTIL